MPEKGVFIEKVANKRSLRDFIGVPWNVYGETDNWVPPLKIERQMALSPSQGVFQHLSWSGWVAYENGVPVGRISAQIDQSHLSKRGDKTGFFGFLEAVDKQSIFSELFKRAENWLKERGMTQVMGPFSLNINQEVGLLVDGFDTDPYFMMPNGLHYYASHLENLAYKKEMDLYAYMIKASFQPPKVMCKLIGSMPKSMTIRSINKKDLTNELEIIRNIFNDAWSENWGFIPFGKTEFQTIGREMLMLIPDSFIQIASIEGEPAAFIVLLPNVNEAVKDLNGKLWPTGWIKLLYRLKITYPKSARIPLMGVRKKYHDTKLGPGLALSVVNALRKPATLNLIDDVEMSWILENNSAMSNIIKILGGYRSKTYRVYKKNL